MKKKITVILSLLLIVGLLGTGVYKSSASGKAPTLTTEEIKQLVSSQYPGSITEIELERDDNRMIYEVEVKNDNKEYDLKLDGNTGEVLELKEKTIYHSKQTADNKHEATETQEAEKQVTDKETKDQPTVIESKEQEKAAKSDSKKKAATNTVISEVRAIEIAKQEFPGTVVNFELDEEDGRLIYEIEIENGDEEAEFEIDAYSGEILVIDIDD